MRLHNTLISKSALAMVAAFVLMIGLTACEESNKPDYLTEPAPNVENLLASGWQNYTDGNYSDAYDNFDQASERDASVPQVYLGLGYASLQMGELERSVSNFQKTIAYAIFDPDNAEMLTNSSNAGLAIAYLALDEFDRSIASATQLINDAPNFQFAFDNSVTVDDIYLARALSSYHVQDYEQSYYDVLAVDANADFSSVVMNENNPNAAVNGNTRDLAAGTVQFTLAGKKLVTVQSVEATIDNSTRAYDVVDFVQGGASATIFGNPVPSSSQTLDISYIHAPNYGLFLDTLMQEIVRLREENH